MVGNRCFPNQTAATVYGQLPIENDVSHSVGIFKEKISPVSLPLDRAEIGIHQNMLLRAVNQNHIGLDHILDPGDIIGPSRHEIIDRNFFDGGDRNVRPAR